jgi:hypothetical protein
VLTGPAGVMALVLAESAAGGAAFLFLTPFWGEVRRGFFYLTGIVVLVLAGSAAGAARVAYPVAPGSAPRLAEWLLVTLTAATLLWLVLLMTRRATAGHVLGIVTVPLAVTTLFALARTTDRSTAMAFFQLLAGATFTGGVLDGLLLGHWYLTDRRLTRGPINRMAMILFAGVGLEAVGVIAGGFGSNGQTGTGNGTLNPLLTIGGLASWIALGMVACTGLIAVFIRLVLKGTRPAAVQSATGFFYLAVITAFTAELAAKVRFLP